jgi:membrane protein insertase Oxa1/YidC/SpoIIIJ
MPQEKINQLNTKFAAMQEKVDNLVCQNTKEHDAIFKKLDEIQKTLSDQSHGAEMRRSEYIECFATKKEQNAIEMRLEVLSQFYWKVIGILGAISFITSVFGENILAIIKK